MSKQKGRKHGVEPQAQQDPGGDTRWGLGIRKIIRRN